MAYSFGVTEDVQPGELMDGNDLIDDNRVGGKMAARGDDSYRFAGSLTSFECHGGPVTVRIDFGDVD